MAKEPPGTAEVAELARERNDFQNDLRSLAVPDVGPPGRQAWPATPPCCSTGLGRNWLACACKRQRPSSARWSGAQRSGEVRSHVERCSVSNHSGRIVHQTSFRLHLGSKVTRLPASSPALWRSLGVALHVMLSSECAHIKVKEHCELLAECLAPANSGKIIDAT
jgi:hypothetical protein